nr:TetR family transcriptional regulator [Mycobacterium sp. RTGN5]
MASADATGVDAFTAKGRATRERILQAAANVLLAQGVSGLTLDLVRQTAGVSGSQLTHYFTDKPTLIRAVIGRQMEVVLDFHQQPKLGGLDTFADWERWATQNVEYLRRIGYTGTPTYHTLAGQLAKTDESTREALALGYGRWIDLLEQSFSRMRDSGTLVPAADPRQLANIFVAGHQGSGSLTFAYRQEWPLADTVRFLVNYLRLFAADPAERVVRKARRPRRRPTPPQQSDESGPPRFTGKGLATRARIVRGAAELIFDRGVNGTSLDDVRTAVGASGSQLAHYFADKRDLTRQVIAARTDDVVAWHTRPELGQLSSITALQTWAQACIADIDTVYLRGGCVYGSLAGELLEADEGVLDDLASGYDRWLELFHAGLTRMIESGELIDTADARHLSAVLVIAHQGGTMLTHATGSPDPFRYIATAAVDYVASFRAVQQRRTARTKTRPTNKP